MESPTPVQGLKDIITDEKTAQAAGECLNIEKYSVLVASTRSDRSAASYGEIRGGSARDGDEAGQQSGSRYRGG